MKYLTEKSEEELIGALVKLKKRESELYTKVEKLEDTYRGPFHDALEKRYSDNMNDPDRNFKAQMSINPDRIIAIATELKGAQKEYGEAHAATRQFEAMHPEIAKMLEPRYY